MYTKDKVTLEESLPIKYFPSSEALDCTVKYIIKLKLSRSFIRTLKSKHISWDMPVSLDMVKGHPPRNVNVFCTRQ